jgi:hypothetical protein
VLKGRTSIGQTTLRKQCTRRPFQRAHRLAIHLGFEERH